MQTPKLLLPYGRQWIDEADCNAVIEALHSDWLTGGPRVQEFEALIAKYCNCKHAIAVSSGTAALHLSMLAAGIETGSRVLTSTNSFLASANCAAFVGAIPDFVDISAGEYNLSPQALAEHWTDDVKAVIAVDFAGLPCEMYKIAEIARRHGAAIIEDACHALGSAFELNGARYMTGGHPWADMTIFSFHPVKTITTGEGGAIVTDNDQLALRCRLLRNHGMLKNQEEFLGLGHADFNEVGPWYYEMHELGYNYRLTDLQCALGITQLSRIDDFVARRKEIVCRYDEAFAELPHVEIPRQVKNVFPSWHLYVLQIDFIAIGKKRSQVMQSLTALGVTTQVHYIPIHLQPYYRQRFGYGPGKCPVAEAYYQRCLTLPLYPSMTDADVNWVIDSVTRVVSSAPRVH
jgi:UDP-4-amino-4,6-dideoxy-N-acetyl-beta-L-altrosamine transaminase